MPRRKKLAGPSLRADVKPEHLPAFIYSLSRSDAATKKLWIQSTLERGEVTGMCAAPCCANPVWPHDDGCASPTLCFECCPCYEQAANREADADNDDAPMPGNGGMAGLQYDDDGYGYPVEQGVPAPAPAPVPAPAPALVPDPPLIGSEKDLADLYFRSLLEAKGDFLMPDKSRVHCLMDVFFFSTGLISMRDYDLRDKHSKPTDSLQTATELCLLNVSSFPRMLLQIA